MARLHVYLAQAVCSGWALLISAKQLELSLSESCGQRLHCRALGDSSAGRAFLGVSHSEAWIIKVFPIEHRHIPVRALDILLALAEYSLPTPQPTLSTPILLGSHCAYAYRYVPGTPSRDQRLSLSDWHGLGTLIQRLCDCMQDTWRLEKLNPALYKPFDLERALLLSADRLRNTYPDLAAKASAIPARPEPRSEQLTPIHSDLHPGNVIDSGHCLTPIDFDGVVLGTLEKAAASMVGKLCEFRLSAGQIHERIDAVAASAFSGRRPPSTINLRLCVLEKKLAELWFLEQYLSRSGPHVAACLRFRRDTLRGLDWLLREWPRVAEATSQ